MESITITDRSVPSVRPEALALTDDVLLRRSLFGRNVAAEFSSKEVADDFSPLVPEAQLIGSWPSPVCAVGPLTRRDPAGSCS